MHSVGLDTHGNAPLSARGLQQPEPTSPVNPVPTLDDGEDDGSFGAAVTVTLSEQAKAHMGLAQDGGPGKSGQSTAHQARAMMADVNFTSSESGNTPFGKIVSQIAQLGFAAAKAILAPTPAPPPPVEEVDDEPAAEGEPVAAPAGEEGGGDAPSVALAPAPVAPLEDLLLEEGLLAPLAGGGTDENDDPDVTTGDDPEPLTV